MPRPEITGKPRARAASSKAAGSSDSTSSNSLISVPSQPPVDFGSFEETITLPWNVPVHDPVSLIPGDVYDPGTSSAPRLDRATADARILDYAQMEAAQEVAQAGYGFIESVFNTQTAYQKALGAGFKALREGLATQRHQVAAATAVVDLNTEKLKFGVAVQKNRQQTVRLNGEIEMTNLVGEQTQARIDKVRNDIQGLKAQAQLSLQKASSLEAAT